MTRRIALAVTTVAVLAAGAGAASAATGATHSRPAQVTASTPEHQLCLLLYRSDPKPQHICVNW